MRVCARATQIHEKHIMDMQFSVDETHCVTASTDRTAKLLDSASLEVLKVYPSTVPVNSAAMSPIFDHILIGGGQDASQVRASRGRARVERGRAWSPEPRAKAQESW